MKEVDLLTCSILNEIGFGTNRTKYITSVRKSLETWEDMIQN